MASVFISYRRNDVPAQAGRVADRLRAHPSAPEVFHDTAEIRPGDLWKERIDNALAQCDVMLVVIGPAWLAAEPGAARPRLFEPDDVVAYEIEAGLRRKVRIVPLRVGGAPLPTKAQLPAALAGLLASNALEIRDDAFDRDMRALEAGILPAAPQRKRWWAGAAAAVVLLAFIGGLLWRKPAVVGPQPAGIAAADVDLDVDLAFLPHKAMEKLGLPANSLQLVPEKPKRRGPLKLERQPAPAGGPAHFLYEKLLLPHAGETFVGTLARELDGAVQVTAENSDAIQTLVCLDVTRALPPADGKLHLTCREGQRCVPDSGGIVVPCGASTTATGSALRWTDLIPSAHAQTVVASGASAPAAASRPAPGDWLVPKLDTLRARRGTPQAVAFSEVSMTMGLPPQAPAADEVTYDIWINGHRLWVNGLPAWTHATQFKTGEPCRVAFGLENLDSSGQYGGKERVEVRIVLLRDKRPVYEDRLTFDFHALRDEAEQVAVTAGGQPVRWTAAYSPASTDRYQIFAYGGGETDTLSAREKLVAARVPAGAGQGAAPLVGVVRPPNRSNKSWGVAVGVAQASGQVRFSFDANTAKALCAWMAEDAQARRFRSGGFEPPANFRVREIASDTNDAAPKPAVPCSAFGKA